MSRPSLSAASAAPGGGNDLGRLCKDADYSVLSLLLPYNSLHAQLIVNGRLITTPCQYQVTSQAAAEATGSLNRTSAAKSDFWIPARTLYRRHPD